MAAAREGYPAYTTTPGWLGYDDAMLDRLCREAVADGFGQVKLKVGADLGDELRRLAIARAACGPEVAIAVDANQRWDVADAIAWFAGWTTLTWPGLRSPPVPDDALGHAAIARGIAPIPVATGEHLANRVLTKQFLQAGGCSVLQIDATRVAGVNESLRRACPGRPPRCVRRRSSSTSSGRDSPGVPVGQQDGFQAGAKRTELLLPEAAAPVPLHVGEEFAGGLLAVRAATGQPGSLGAAVSRVDL